MKYTMKVFLTFLFFIAVLILGSTDYFISKNLGYNICETHVRSCE